MRKWHIDELLQTKKDMKEIDTNKEISVINSIQVPVDHEQTTLEVRDMYIEYFKTKSDFVSSTFYKSINPNNTFNYVNIIVWDSLNSFQKAVNEGFNNVEGLTKMAIKCWEKDSRLQFQ